MSSNSLTPLNLSDQDYFIRTTDTQNPYLGIRGLNDIVGYGVYSFTINGSQFLKKGSEIKIEAIDSDGNQILITGVKNLLKGTSRVVTFTIDETITGSTATLYISAILSQFRERGTLQNVPQEWDGVENFLFEYNFGIDTSRINSDEIIFRKYPTVSIVPLTKVVKRVSKSTTTTNNIIADVKSYNYDASKSKYILNISTNSDEFVVDMEGGEVQIVGEEVPIYGNILLNPPSPKRNAIIELFNPDLELYDKEKFKGLIQSPITFTVTYTSITEYDGSILQQQSYADMFIQDMEVVSGDVQKIKIFTKSDTLDTDYSLNSEHDVVFKNLLEIDGVGNIGLFNVSNKLNYWNVTKIDSGVSDPSILQDNTIFLSAITITGDYDNPNTKVVKERTLQTPRYELKSDIGLNLKKDTNYNLTLNAAVTNVPSTEDTRLDVYLSGSNLPVGCSNQFGTLIHSFRTNTDKVWDNQFDIIYNRENDVPDGELVFVATAGKWYLQNIQFAPQVKQGFSPPEFRVQFPVQISKPNQDLDFKIQFYDGNDNKADFVLSKNNVIFSKPNIVIEGDQNVGTGSIFFGSTSGSGIEIGGSGDGAIIRSIGYEGFESGSAGTGSGFLLYSGSVLPEYPDNYSGVGLELFLTTESYFRYRTDINELDIRTDKFFIGQELTQFISGSDSNIEISSSLFHLDPKNDLLIIGSNAVINADLTVNEIRTPALIGGSPSTTANASSSINSDGYAKFVSASIGGFDVSETIISSSNLEINSNGTIRTSDFIDGVSGWIISSQGNGTAQFESVKIRGTLRTTVFEKETVNAVGGQLWVANSTTFSQSVSNSTQDFPLDNVTGFEVDEILLIKKITDTGFNTEYVKVNSVTRTSPSSDTDFSGIINVDRAYQSGLPTGSGVTWVSELASSAESYTDGQVIVSTGKENTGWILLNASPNNTYTPYIDIVERTGSGVYDYELKARLGDLSGISSNLLSGETNPGFGLYSENVFLTGTITAESGSIGNFQIIDGKISGSNITMDANNSLIFKTDQGPGSDPQPPGQEALSEEYYIDFRPSGSGTPFYIKMGPNFSVDKTGSLIASGAIIEGTITAQTGEIGGFIINTSSLSSVDNSIFISGSPTPTGFFISSSNFNVKGNGDITGSSVLFDGGTIAGWDIEQGYIQENIDSRYITLSSNLAIDGGDIYEPYGLSLYIDNSELESNTKSVKIIRVGQISEKGTYDSFINGNPTFGLQIWRGATTTGGEIFRIDSGSALIGGLEIEQTTIGDSGNKLILRANGDITGSSVLFDGGTIGGFTITDSFISSSGLIIQSDGTIFSSDYVPNQRGFSITAADNGFAEFQHAKIRGTLSTTVFEKQTINAVGGQLWVANATTLSQSVDDTSETFLVASGSGFEAGEILLIKKETQTGFNSEYVKIHSVTNNTLIVTRSIGSTTAEDYTEGQVLVSTGKQDTGYVLINANPDDTSTPYIDIVERTGSGVLDTELKVRLGDLSGLTEQQLFGTDPNNAGFGLYSENAFLQGSVIATSGQIGPFPNIQTLYARDGSVLKYGDLNFDGSISDADSTAILEYLVDDNVQFSPLEFQIGDVTGNGEIDGADASLILRHVANLSGTGSAGTPTTKTGDDYWYTDVKLEFNTGSAFMVGSGIFTGSVDRTQFFRIQPFNSYIDFLEVDVLFPNHINGGTFVNSRASLNYLSVSGSSIFSGSVDITGTLSKPAGSFRIPHPNPNKPDKELWHSFVESPTTGDNIYRWEVEAVSGSCDIQLPDYYKYLNENDQVWVSPVKHFGQAYGEVNEEQTILTIYSNQDGLYNVLLIGTRKDEIAKNHWKGTERDR